MIRNTIPGTVAMATLLACCLMVCSSGFAKTNCRWVWNGMNSQWVCDEDRGPGRARLCDFEERRGRRGARFTVSTYCRPDGSIWKEVVVRPRAVVTKLYSRDGRLLSRNRIKTEGYDHPSYRERRRHGRVEDISGNYVGRIVGGRMFVHIQQKRKQLGVRVDIYNFLGQKNTFHFKGRLKGNRIRATHDSGHRFTGVLQGRGIIEGVVNMDDGRRIGITLHKT